MAGWVTGGYPGGSAQPTTGDNFPWKQAPCKLVLHTTEGSSYPNWGYNKSSHVTIHPLAFTWRQHRALDKPAWTLKAPVGQVSTNSMGAIQVEIIGYAASIKNLSGAPLDYLLGFLRFIADQTGIPLDCTVLFGGSETAGVNGTRRLSAARWTAYRGILGHQHVPGNDHWDPGDIPMQALWLPKIRGTAPTPEPIPTPPSEDSMYLISAPNRGVGLISAGYFLSLSPGQADAWRAVIVADNQKQVTDDQFDQVRGTTNQADAWVPPVSVDTSGLTVDAKVTDEDKEDISNRTVDKMPKTLS